jgi:hypothetical protein
MADHLAPGGEAILGSSRNSWSTLRRKSASTGQLERMAIPGYTGHVPGRNAENISGVTHAEAGRLSETAVSRRMVPRSGADSERLRQWRGHDVMSQTIDMGSMSAGIGTSNLDGLTQQKFEHGPSCKTTSMFYNPRGHTKLRCGAAVPGYAGHIPGKYAGNVFASTYGQANLAASGVRRREGAENGTNWILACEYDKAAKNHGATSDLRRTIRTIGFHEGSRDPQLDFCGRDCQFAITKPTLKTRVPKAIRHEEQLDQSVWRLSEPATTHQKLRCYGH